MVNYKKPKKVVKVLTREMPICGIEAFFDGYNQEIKNQLGLKFPPTLFYSQKDTFFIYRDLEFNTKFPRKVALWFKRNKNKIIPAYNKVVKALKFYLKVAKKKYLTPKELLNDLNQICFHFRNALPGFLIIFWIPIWQENFEKLKKTKLFKDIEAKKIKKMRIKTEKFFDASMDAMFILLNKMARQLGVEKKILKYATLEELKNWISNNKPLPIREIKNRENDFIIFNKELIYKSQIKKRLKELNIILEGEEKKAKAVKEFKGTIANKGMARGKVKIIFNRNELNKMSKGDILVAPMTTPWYLPAIKIASAIVTDEGGITCHAAIVSRELKIPCIIGTKIATKVLRDGDLVEVDANKGIVRIIK